MCFGLFICVGLCYCVSLRVSVSISVSLCVSVLVRVCQCVELLFVLVCQSVLMSSLSESFPSFTRLTSVFVFL